jgi:hypothetical protein
MLDFTEVTKSRISLSDLNFQNLGAILRSDKGAALLKQISEEPDLSEDIFALAHKKRELDVPQAPGGVQHLRGRICPPPRGQEDGRGGHLAAFLRAEPVDIWPRS